MHAKHHKKKWATKRNAVITILGTVAVALVSQLPAIIAASRQTPKNEDALISRKVDIDDIYYKLQTLTERVDKIETNKPVKGK